MTKGRARLSCKVVAGQRVKNISKRVRGTADPSASLPRISYGTEPTVASPNNHLAVHSPGDCEHADVILLPKVLRGGSDDSSTDRFLRLGCAQHFADPLEAEKLTVLVLCFRDP